MFRKGQSKPAGSGRQKGTQNKKRLPALAEYLAGQNVNPLQEIINLIPSLDPADKLAAWKTLLSYCYVKPTESTGEDGVNPPIADDDTPTAELMRMVQ